MSDLLNNFNFAVNNYIFKKHPISLIHFITNRCNARCSFCFIDFDDPETFRGELTIEEIEKISKTFGPSLKNINLTGGEPFARKEINEIAKIYFKNTTIDSLFITSNGSLPDRIESFLNEISNHHHSKKVILSYSLDDFEENHNRVRKIKNLFQSVIDSYNIAKSISENIFANVSITVSHENCENITEIYEHLKSKGIRSITACLVRDEGVYKTPIDKKTKIINAYKELTKRIITDRKEGIMEGYNKEKILGRMMNKKNDIMYEKIIDTYLNNNFISTCFAGSLFGIISSKGDIYPCEILDSKKLGNLRDYGLDFQKIWFNEESKKTKKWIKDTKCRCCYECAWSYNILGNLKYQKPLITSALKIDS